MTLSKVSCQSTDTTLVIPGMRTAYGFELANPPPPLFRHASGPPPYFFRALVMWGKPGGLIRYVCDTSSRAHAPDAFSRCSSHRIHVDEPSFAHRSIHLRPLASNDAIAGPGPQTAQRRQGDDLDNEPHLGNESFTSSGVRHARLFPPHPVTENALPASGSVLPDISPSPLRSWIVSTRSMLKTGPSSLPTGTKTIAVELKTERELAAFHASTDPLS